MVGSSCGDGAVDDGTVPCETAADDGAAPRAMTTSIDTTTPSVRPRRRLRVLLVDDARMDRDLCCAHLRGAGYDVQVATDGLEALACAVARRRDRKSVV